MNLDRILFWIRLIGQAILDILDVLDDEPGTGVESLEEPPPGFKPERIQVWIGIFARAAVQAVDEVGPPPEESGVESAGAFSGAGVAARGPSHFKPERIQFWLKLIARFVMAVFRGRSGVSEETGKSGARSGVPAFEEVDN